MSRAEPCRAAHRRWLHFIAVNFDCVTKIFIHKIFIDRLIQKVYNAMHLGWRGGAWRGVTPFRLDNKGKIFQKAFDRF